MNWRFTVYMVLAVACWGVGTVISKGVLAYLPPLTLLVVQLTVSIACLWVAIVAQHVKISLSGQMVRYALTGLLEPGFAYTLSLIGLTMTTASMSSLIWDVEPILIIALAFMILRERVTRPLMLLSVVAIAGVVLVAGVDVTVRGNLVLMGNLLTLAGVFCCVTYVVLTRRIVSTLDTLPLVALQQTVAWVWVLAIWPTELMRSSIQALSSIGLNIWGWAILSGVVSYALAFWFYVTGLKRTPASLAGFFINLVPIFVVGGAYLFLGERLTAIQWIGAILILVSVGTIFCLQRADTTLVTAYP